MTQTSLLPKLDPDALIAEVKAEHNPVRTFCLFSGGNDSLGVAHRCREPEWFEERIGSLEREAEAKGLPCAKWGVPCDKTPSEEEVGLICSTCEQLSLT